MHLGGNILVPAPLRTVAGDSARAFGEGGVKEALATAFRSARRVVLVLPVGAAVRLVAPLLAHKQADPGVVVVDEAGAHAIALLSSHVGGANTLARDVAAAVGARPVVTSAADVLGIPALDLLGRAWGWTIEDSTHLTHGSAALIAGEPVGAYQDAGQEDWWRDAPRNLTRYSSIEALIEAPVTARLVVSDRILAQGSGVGGQAIVYRPKTLVVGVGCVRGATDEELDDLICVTLAQHGLALTSVRELATIDVKRDEAGIRELAARHGWPTHFFSSDELAAVSGPSAPSPVVARAVRTPAVCEPAALLAAGATTLVVPKSRTARATVAVARVHTPTAVGHLAVVGLGPGALGDLTARAREALESADVVVGYDGYLDLVRPWLGDKTYHGSAIGQEVERCRLAIALAQSGQGAALVSSGDAGIYGTAGIVFEILAEDHRDRSSSPGPEDVEVIPGVSAAQAAAALVGAPLMCDFAAISLSDILTPWGEIARRFEAAARGGLVLALYNPASSRRRHQLREAQAILLRHRSSDTAVGIVRNASRPGEEATITDLGHLLDYRVDMLTTVIVGNTATIRVGDRLVTRRGYRGERHAGRSPSK